MGKYRQIALDFDGCIFNKRVIFESNNPNRVIDGNKELLNLLIDENRLFDGIILSTASNRQSVHIEKSNAGRGNGCYSFPALLQIEKFLKRANHMPPVELDAFLLADIRGNLDAGRSFKMAIDSSIPVKSQPHCFFDETKATLLYAQIHKTASEHPNDEITYDYFDDRTDILSSVTTLFSQYPDLLPKNVTVRMFEYNGYELFLHSETKGTSGIDVNYRETVKQMCKNYLTYTNKPDSEFTALRTHETTTIDALSNRIIVSGSTEPCETDTYSLKKYTSSGLLLFNDYKNDGNHKESSTISPLTDKQALY